MRQRAGKLCNLPACNIMPLCCPSQCLVLLCPSVVRQLCPVSWTVQSKIAGVRQEQSQIDCIFFKQGRCSKGSLCPFRHDSVSLV